MPANPLPPVLPTLRTDRLTLRPFMLADGAAWFAWATDPRVFGPTSDVPPAVPEAFSTYLELLDQALTAGQAIRWAIADAHDRAIGTIGIQAFDARNSRAEIGYVLAHDEWHRGLASECAARVIQYARDELALRRIEATVMVGNDQSARVLTRLGFEREGTLRSYKDVRGERRDYWIFALVL